MPIGTRPPLHHSTTILLAAYGSLMLLLGPCSPPHSYFPPADSLTPISSFAAPSDAESYLQIRLLAIYRFTLVARAAFVAGFSIHAEVRISVLSVRLRSVCMPLLPLAPAYRSLPLFYPVPKQHRDTFFVSVRRSYRV